MFQRGKSGARQAADGTTRPEYVTGNVQRLQTPVPADLWPS